MKMSMKPQMHEKKEEDATDYVTRIMLEDTNWKWYAYDMKMQNMTLKEREQFMEQEHRRMK